MTLHLTQENFEKEVIKSEIPVIIDFYADWCMPCRMMAPVFEELSKEYEGKLKFLKLNTETELEIAQQFEIYSIPTLSIIYKDKELGRLSGFMPKERLKAEIDSLLLAKLKK